MDEQPIPSSALADAVGPGLGAGVRSGAAEVVPVTVPGVASTVVWRVRDDHLDHPLQAYVGYRPDVGVVLLSDDQDAWAALIAAAGARIDDAGTALGYIRQFLEITRGPAVPVREIAGLDDVPWRPGTADQERRRTELLAGPPPPGPVAERTGAGFHVELTLVVGQRLQRNLFDVTTDGRVDASFRVIADDLPLPIVR